MNLTYLNNIFSIYSFLSNLTFFVERMNLFNFLNNRLGYLYDILPIDSFFSNFTFLINGMNVIVLKDTSTRCF